MKTRGSAWLGGTLIVAVSTACAWAGEPWRTFESKTGHFSVRYPASWCRLGSASDLGPNPDALDILNFPDSERAQGVVIKELGAEIEVIYGPGNPSAITAVEAAARKERDLAVGNPAPRGCKSLREVTWRDDVSGWGKAYQVHTYYYCPTAYGLFAVSLTNWEGDPKQEELRSLAREIAMTIRAQ